MSHVSRVEYPFENGLAKAEQLLVLAMDPAFSSMAAKLPPFGQKTKPSVIDAKGMLVMGAASVLFGSDRSAEAELRFLWPLLRGQLGKATVATTAEAPSASSWRDFRRRLLTAPVFAELRDESFKLWLGQARAKGMLGGPETAPLPAGYDWMRPDHLRTVYGDASWFLPASGVGIRGQKSRGQPGNERLSEDVDESAKYTGYYQVVVSVRRPEERMRVILHVDRTRPGGEIDVALEGFRRVRAEVGDGAAHFLYDRALSAERHLKELVSMGVLPLCKPAGVDAMAEWKEIKDTPMKKGQLQFHLEVDGCRHYIGMNAGMMWDMEHRQNTWVYGVRADHQSVSRYVNPDESHGFEIAIQLRCGNGQPLADSKTPYRWHSFTVRFTEPLAVPDRRGSVALVNSLRPIPVADHELASLALGRRNDAESVFNNFKNQRGLGPRAKSYTVLAHQIDLWLLAWVHNALTWAEWRQSHQGLLLAA